MSSNPPLSRAFGGSLERFARRARRVFRRRIQVTESHTSSPPPPPSSGASVPQLTAAHNRFTQVTYYAWSDLKFRLRLLENTLHAFPPLKSAVAEFLGVVDIFEASNLISYATTAAQHREDYAELALNLQETVNEFREYPGEHTSYKMSDALNVMTGRLQKEMEHMQEQRQHLGLGWHIEGVGGAQGCYRRIEALCHELQIWGIEQQLDPRLVKLNPASTAIYDSNISTTIGRRKCTPGTRRLLLEGMRIWADDSRGPKAYWLSGMAGTGKTTLAYTFCAELKATRRLGASFFCSRADPDSREVSRIVPTIAHQLAHLLPAYRDQLIRRIDKDEDIGAWNIGKQFNMLIRDPLHEVRVLIPAGVVVTIDALDECDKLQARDILNSIFLHARSMPIKFFLACRQEPRLYHIFDWECELHDLGKTFVPTAQADIRSYLKDELSSISLSQEKLERLVEQAGTQFIYAATAVRYIDPNDPQVNSLQRLEVLLSIPSNTRATKHCGLDDLYTTVLATPLSDEALTLKEKETIWLVLTMAARAGEPMSITTMAQLLEWDEQRIIYALRHFRSVLYIPHDANHITAFHASFSDFILGRERSGFLFSNFVELDRQLALRCFRTMQRLLRFNICELDSSFIIDRDIPDLVKKVNEAISPELFYACRYWVCHLGVVETLDGVSSALEGFLSTQLLFWMEVMNLRNCIGTGAEMIAEAHRWLQASPSISRLLGSDLKTTQKSGGKKHTVELALDASKFVSAFGKSPASRSTPHIYVSALPFWPQTRPVRLRYWTRTQGLIRLEGSAMERRAPSRLKMRTTNSTFYCVAFSPDGTRIASGSRDKAIWVWDARSGDVIAGPLKGHLMSVMSVAFSPGGTRIVSGSEDRTILIWDARSGDVVAGPFEGHTSEVTSVGFSPDGTHIVSGSEDRTILIWDARSGDVVAGPFEGHTRRVTSVGFSPDGTRIVSGSQDMTIRAWDARNGDVVAGSFRGHTSWVNSVGPPPDRTRIASGPCDRTIRFWDVRSGDVAAGPFDGCIRRVTSVGFSPDGTRIVSSSQDMTIRAWDARSGNVVAGPFRGHTRRVTSVGFSPDGTRIVSGSQDMTIRVWDAWSGNVVAGPFEGHTRGVTSVGFSPDGTRIVSGSWDMTIRVWDLSSLAVHASRPLADWLMDGDGMVTTQQGQLLLYVPLDLHVGLLRPQNTLCIHENGTLALHFDGVLLGRDWVKCYRF